jgi:ATP-dependent RNA helicase DeaD
VAKFKERVTTVLASGDATPYRTMIDELVKESGVDAADVAAALARLVQGKTPLLLGTKSAREDRTRDEDSSPGSIRREKRSAQFAPDRGEEEGREPPRPRGRRHDPQQTYRLAVGREHGVQPGNIVGAIANEAGLDGSHINGIDIHSYHSFVRLPEGISPETLKRLGKVRVKGQLLAIVLAEDGPQESQDAPRQPFKKPFSKPFGKPFKKPFNKSFGHGKSGKQAKGKRPAKS